MKFLDELKKKGRCPQMAKTGQIEGSIVTDMSELFKIYLNNSKNNGMANFNEDLVRSLVVLEDFSDLDDKATLTTVITHLENVKRMYVSFFKEPAPKYVFGLQIKPIGLNVGFQTTSQNKFDGNNLVLFAAMILIPTLFLFFRPKL